MSRSSAAGRKTVEAGLANQLAASEGDNSAGMRSCTLAIEAFAAIVTTTKLARVGLLSVAGP